MTGTRQQKWATNGSRQLELVTGEQVIWKTCPEFQTYSFNILTNVPMPPWFHNTVMVTTPPSLTVFRLYLVCTFWYQYATHYSKRRFFGSILSNHQQQVHWTVKCISNRQNHKWNHMTATEALANIKISFVPFLIPLWNFSLSTQVFNRWTDKMEGGVHLNILIN